MQNLGKEAEFLLLPEIVVPPFRAELVNLGLRQSKVPGLQELKGLGMALAADIQQMPLMIGDGCGGGLLRLGERGRSDLSKEILGHGDFLSLSVS